MKDPNQIYVWAQMFFDDGSVSQGMRVDASIYDEGSPLFDETCQVLLKSVNRDVGVMLVWGAGEIYYCPVIKKSTSSLEASDSSALES